MFLHSLVESPEGVTKRGGAVGCRLDNGVQQFGEVGLEMGGALLDDIGLCMYAMQSSAPVHKRAGVKTTGSSSWYSLQGVKPLNMWGGI